MVALRLGRPHAAAALVLALAATTAFSVPTFASDKGVPSGPGCSCHADLPSTAVNITAEGWPLVYTPLTSYTVTLVGTGDVLGLKAGFSALVSKGNLSSPDPNVAAAGNYATHLNPDERSWVLAWLAPAEDSGNATLTVYVNLVNGDGTENPEDHWNVASFTAVERAPEPPKPSHLEVSFDGGAQGPVAGVNFSVVATLVNNSSAPIPNAPIAFTYLASFGNLSIGSARTDANGSARIVFMTVAQGEFVFAAHYDGSSKNLSADATAAAVVADPEGVFDSYYGRPAVSHAGIFDPVRVPLGLIVGGVWVTFAFAGLQVLRVRKAGAPAEDGLSDLFRLAFARKETKEKPKP